MNDGSIVLTFLAPSDFEGRLGDVVDGSPVAGSEIVSEDAGVVRVRIWLSPVHVGCLDGLRGRLAAAGVRRIEVDRVEWRDWLEPYRRSARPFPVGKSWWIEPHSDRPDSTPPGRIRLIIEPRSAFGSGTHESTQLVLLELEELELDGRAVVDVGTGSGVLSLAATARGAGPVVGIDIDPVSGLVARETADQQGWDDLPLLVVGEPASLAGGRFDIVLCNIISSVLIPMLPQLRRLGRSGATIVLSGLLATELGRIRSELGASGLTLVGERTMGEWLSVRVTHG